MKHPSPEDKRLSVVAIAALVLLAAAGCQARQVGASAQGTTAAASSAFLSHVDGGLITPIVKPVRVTLRPFPVAQMSLVQSIRARSGIEPGYVRQTIAGTVEAEEAAGGIAITYRIDRATLDTNIEDARSGPLSLQGATFRILLTRLGEIRDLVVSAPGFTQASSEGERAVQQLRAAFSNIPSMPVNGFTQAARDFFSIQLTIEAGETLTLRLHRTVLGLAEHRGRSVVVCAYGMAGSNLPALNEFSGFSLLDIETGASLVSVGRYVLSGTSNGRRIDIETTQEIRIDL